MQCEPDSMELSPDNDIFEDAKDCLNDELFEDYEEDRNILPELQPSEELQNYLNKCPAYSFYYEIINPLEALENRRTAYCE